MRRLRLLFLLPLWLALSAAAPEGSAPELSFEHLSLDDGLSQSSVMAMLQGREGYMWFGTQDGLNRYDGYSFTVYRPHPDDSTSLSGSIVTALYEDRQGTLWVGTDKGVNRFDRGTGGFRRYVPTSEDVSGGLQPPGRSVTGLGTSAVTALAGDRAGRLWVATESGVYRFDPKGETFVSYQFGPAAQQEAPAVLALLQDRSGVLWAGTTEGLYCLEPGKRTLRSYAAVSGNRELSTRIVGALFEDRKGVLWVGTSGGTYRLGPSPDTSRNRRRMTAVPADLRNDRVRAFHGDGVGPLWMATNDRGLVRYDVETQTVTRYRRAPDDPGSLSQDNLYSVCEDRFGGLWVGTHADGLNHAERDGRVFTHYRHRSDDPGSLSEDVVFGVLKDRRGILWVGTAGGGLNRLDPGQEAFTHYTAARASGSLKSDFVTSLLEDRRGRLWLGVLEGGLNRFNREEQSFTTYLHDPKDPTSLSSNAVWTIHEGANGRLWVGTRGSGLNRFDPETETFTRYHHDPSDPTTLSSNNVLVLHEGPGERLWVGTFEAGLNLFDPSTGTAVHYRHDPDDPTSLSSDAVSALVRDASGTLWVGTYDGGLNRFDADTETFTRYTEQNSDLPSNTIVSILKDDHGDLWMGTYSGLVRFDPATGAVRVYGPDRGVQSKEFNMGAAYKSSRGRLFFGGVKGLNAFDPAAVRDNRQPPLVDLTELEVRGRRAVSLADTIGGQPLALMHDEDDLIFQYVGLHYAAPKHNTYAYRLDGYDDGWQEAGTRRRATYTNLDPGRYVFRVRAANRNGVWSPEPARMAFTIRPPWWDTWWAYGLYALLLGSGVALIYRRQRARWIRREREEAAVREAELKAEIAEAESARKSQELEEARQLQLSMLPHTLPELSQAEIAAHMKTATEVGGDYYDFHHSEDGTLLIAIGDATGHGMKAGTMVTATKALFGSLTGEGDLTRMLRVATRMLRRLGLNRLYMALALARLSGRRLELAGAGLPPALVWRAEDDTVEEISLKGMPLGGLEGFPYQQRTVELTPGDVVVLMSDGFPEMLNPEGEMLGYDQAAEVLREAMRKTGDPSPQAVIEHFEAAGRRWAAGRAQNDDVTFVALKMKMKATSEAVHQSRQVERA